MSRVSKIGSEAMTLFLQEVASRHVEEFIIMVMDGAGWHKANALKIPENMRLLFLPPYSPELNPTEHVWDEIREKWFANKAFPDLDVLEDQLVIALYELESDKKRIATLTGFKWIVSIILNAT